MSLVVAFTFAPEITLLLSVTNNNNDDSNNAYREIGSNAFAKPARSSFQHEKSNAFFRSNRSDQRRPLITNRSKYYYGLFVFLSFPFTSLTLINKCLKQNRDTFFHYFHSYDVTVLIILLFYYSYRSLVNNYYFALQVLLSN